MDLAPAADAPGRALMQTQRFSIERLHGVAGDRFAFAARTETILLLPVIGAALTGDRDADLPGHAVVIVPRGSYRIELAGSGDVYILSTDRSDLDDAGAPPRDDRVRAVGAPRRRVVGHDEVRIHPITEIAIPPDNGRLRFLQSETMSINWVEYEGVRDRAGLSPHAHTDFEQASLAIAGNFVHHLRTPWGRDADLWQDDAHLAAGPASVIAIPPEIIHTTEGVGEGRHVLVDVFAPPRDDFIARNWVFNAAEYLPPAAAD
ncbi:hypothetical protein [Sphingomonas sp. MMS24-J13]|uniref:hypothetical protein n=1 Tax=Sphingomonas sp. MMS24-J13 TaxID=3238686 RepID=UPI00384AA44E